MELCFTGAPCNLRTNSLELGRALERQSISCGDYGLSGFSMRVIVDGASREPIGEPHFRGLHHVVTASFGRSNLFVWDILRRTLSASVSATVAGDDRFWKGKLIPLTLGVLGCAMGLVPVHCACLESDGDGLLIAGVSGVGKSTLSAALCEEGFNYVSDDWTYMSLRHDGIVAHGTSAPMRLLPDAEEHFQSLQRYSLQTSMNGELAYEVDIAEAFGAQVEAECEPRWLLFLERMHRAGTEFKQMSTADTRSHLSCSVEILPMQLPEAAATREEMIRSVSLLPAWRFRYGGTPQFAAKELREFVVNRRPEVYA
jgi:hypothetical protein